VSSPRTSIFTSLLPAPLDHLHYQITSLTEWHNDKLAIESAAFFTFLDIERFELET
jgi:hypothetical protein